MLAKILTVCLCVVLALFIVVDVIFTIFINDDDVGLNREYPLCCSKWIVGVNLIATRLILFWPPTLVGDTDRF